MLKVKNRWLKYCGYLLAVLFFVALLVSPLIVIASNSLISQAPLELDYPKMPGMGEVNSGQSLNFFIRYLVNGIFFIAAGICAGVLILGGLTYILGSSRVEKVVQARARINRGLLGLAIILGSYLLLVTINPNLLIFNIPTPGKFTPYSPLAEKAAQGEVTFTHAAGLKICEEVLNEMTTQATEKDASGKTKYLFIEDGDYKGDPVLAQEQPFYDTYKYLNEAVKIAEEAQALLKKCTCGIAKTHGDGSGCYPNLDTKEAENFRLGNSLVQPPERLECLTRCETCLSEESGCNRTKLKELREKLKNILGENKNAVDPKTNEPIKNLRSQTARFALERLKFLEETLEQNADEFFINKAEGLFESDFRSQEQEYIAKGYRVIVKEPEFLQTKGQFQQTVKDAQEGGGVKPPTSLNQDIWFSNAPAFLNGFFKLIAGQPHHGLQVLAAPAETIQPSSFNRDTSGFFAPIGASGTANLEGLDNIIKQNQEAELNASRFNFTAVILQMSMEELQGIFRNCLSAAFNGAEFNVTVEQMQEIVKLALQQIDKSVLETLITKKDDLASLYDQHFKAGVKGAFGDKWVQAVAECQQQCVLACPSQDKGCVAPCQEKCLAPPPDFLGNLVASYLSKNVKSMLPDSIQEILNSRLRDAAFKDFNKYLDAEIITFFGDVNHNVFTKSLADNFKFLKDGLNKKLWDIEFLNFATRSLAKIDKFVASSTLGMSKALDSIYKDIASFSGDPFASNLNSFVEGYKKNNPEFFTEYDLQGCPSYVYQGGRILMITEGGKRDNLCSYIGVLNEDFVDKQGVQCLKLTPKEVNEVNEVPRSVEVKSDGGLNEETKPSEIQVILGCEPVGDQDREKLCHGAGYCWINDPANSSSKICKACDYPRVEGSGSFKQDLTNAEKTVVAGSVNFLQGLASAFIQTITYAAVQYARVMVEDQLLTPLRPFIAQVKGWQEDFHKFLYEGTVADALPSAITNTLNSSVDVLLKKVCDQYKSGQDIKWLKPVDWKAIQWNDKPLSSYQGFADNANNWITKKFESPEGKKIGKAACNIYENLHTTLIDEINKITENEVKECCCLAGCKNSRSASPNFDVVKCNNDCKTNPPNITACGDKCQGIKDYLNAKVESFFPQDWQEFLNKSIAEMALGTNGAQLAKANIKQILCGEVLQPTLVPKFDASQQSMSQFCATVKQGGTSNFSLTELTALKGKNAKQRRATMSQKGMGVIPAVDQEKLKVALSQLKAANPKLTDEEIKKIESYAVPMCYFNYYACQNPLASILNGKKMGSTIAELMSFSCQAVEARVASKGLSCGNWSNYAFKPTPDQENFWNDWKTACQTCDLITKHTGSYIMVYGLLTGLYGEPPEKTKPEKNAIEWLWVSFPKWRADIELAGKERGFNAGDYNRYARLEEMPSNDREAAKNIVSWFTNQRTLGDVLTDIPLGVVKPFKKGEASFLKDKGQGLTRNFLFRTPYEFLHQDLCYKIKRDFEKDYSKYTLDAIKRTKLAGLPKNALPYSMESLQRVTTGDVFNALAHLDVDDLTPEAQYSYLSCLALDYSLAEILGLSEKLEYYVRPPEFRILFSFIHDQMMPSEMPQALVNFLKVLYEQTPSGALRQVGSDIKQAGGRFEIFSLNFSTWESVDKANVINALTNNNVSGSKMQTILEAQKVGPNTAEGTVGTVGALGPLKVESGSAAKARWEIPGTKYEIWQYDNSVSVYLLPNVSGDLVMDLADVLDTKLGVLIQRYYNGKMIDAILGDYSKQKLTIDGWNELQQQFNKSLLQLMAEKLPTPLFNPEVNGRNMASANISIMDVISQKNSIFTRPWLDVLFGSVQKNIAKGYFAGKIATEKGYSAVDKAVDKVQTDIQGAFDKVLVDTPQMLWQKIAELWRDRFGKNFSDDAAGAMCKEAISERDCQSGEVFRLNGGKKECCSLGDPWVCSLRCRVKQAGKKCLEENGEVLENGQCCSQACRDCRVATAREVFKKSCNRTDDKYLAEDNYNLCCHDRATRDVVKDGVKTGEQLCCISVTDCVTGQFVESLSILSQMIANNSVPVKSLLNLPADQQPMLGP